MMKVVIPALGLQRNGGNRVLIAIANALAEHGVVCEFIVPGNLSRPGFELHPSIRITPITSLIGSKPLRWLAFFFAAIPRLRGQHVVANHFVTALAAALAHLGSATRVVYLVQDLEYRFYRWPLSRLARRLCHLSYRQFRPLPANPYLEQALQQKGFATRPALTLGPAPAFLHTAPQSQVRDIDVLMFLRRGRHKRLNRYRTIATDLHRRGISLAAIAPDPGLFDEVKAPLMTRLIPDDDSEIIALMDRCRILLMASEHEGFALPPLEAMARGLPVVLFRCGGPEIYARDGVNASFVNGEDDREAADRIVELLEDSNRYDRLASAARHTAEQYDLAGAAKQACAEIMRQFSD